MENPEPTAETPITPPEPIIPSEPTAPVEPPKKNSKAPILVTAICLVGVLLVAGITLFLLNRSPSDSSSSSSSSAAGEYSLEFNKTAWNYDSSNDVYYQIGVVYTGNPVDTTYESLGIYVPGDLMECTASGSTYSCESTDSSAPIVIPVNTPGYSASKAPTSYSYNSVSSYLKAGFIYVNPGIRGRISSGGPNASSSSTSVSYETGAPWGVTDLKAAIRYLRYNSDVLPGNLENIFAFGHSGGGAQTAVLGASGDSELYTPYLEAIGAAMTDKNGDALSDAILGANSWCPITSLSSANLGYEWNMGQFSTSGTRAEGTWTKALSDDLAKEFATYINSMGFKDEDGNTLALEESTSGIYLAGSYYDYLLKVINTSAAGSASFTNLSDFVTGYKSATKSVGAFDNPDKSQTENYVFADSSNNPLHFDDNLFTLVATSGNYVSYSDFDPSSYLTAFTTDFATKDSVGNAPNVRETIYDPINFLTDSENYASTPAKYWRIRSGIEQGDTALTTEVNLYLATLNNKNVESVDFATVWGKGHTEAETSGSATENFISWVKSVTE